MQTYDWFVSDKTSITHQAFEKFFNGAGNPRAVSIAVDTVMGLTDEGDLAEPFKHNAESVTGLLNHGATVFVYSNDTFFASHRSKANPDTILLKFDGTELHFVFMRPADNGAISLTGKVRWDGKKDITDVLSTVLFIEFNNITVNDANIGYFGVLPDKYIIPENEYQYPDSWNYINCGHLENKFDKPAKNVNTNNAVTQNQNSTGEVKMTKVSNIVTANKSAAVSVAKIVTANKSAAVSVAKIEAGRIAVKQAVKLVKPAVPMMARGYLETALGELAVANLFKFAVDNFAPNNDKAKLVADAMLQGAMLGAIQSLNVEQMINDVMDKVDISKFADVTKSEE